MTGLIPMPDERAPKVAPLLWIKPSQIVTAAVIIDRSHQPLKMRVELKLQGLNLNRYWLATGTEDELQKAWDDFAEKIAPSNGSA